MTRSTPPPAMQWCHVATALAFALLCALPRGVSGGVGDSAAELEVMRETWNEDWRAPHLAIVAVLCTVSALLLLGVVAAALLRREGVPLSIMIFSMCFAAVSITGIISWSVTYRRTRRGVAVETEAFARAAAARACDAVAAALETVPLLNEVWADGLDSGAHAPDETYPTPFLRLSGHARAARSAGAAVLAMTWTDASGQRYGVSPATGRTIAHGMGHTRQRGEAYHVHDADAQFIQYTFRADTDPVRAAVLLHPDMTCVGADTDGAACAAVDPAACAANATARALCAGTCGVASTRACVGDVNGALRMATFRVANWTSAKPLGPAVSVETLEPGRTPFYDPQGPGAVWSEPYVLHAGVEEHGDHDGDDHDDPPTTSPHIIALTASFAVQKPGGMPGEYAGIVATEVALDGLLELLAPMQPTPGSRLAVATYTGSVLAGTLAAPDLFEPVPQGVTLGSTRLRSDAAAGAGPSLSGAAATDVSIRTVSSAPAFVQNAFAAVTSRYGVLQGARGRISILHERIDGAWHLIVAQPLDITGLQLLLVLSVPYDDVFRDAVGSGTNTLLLIFGVSVGLCIIIQIFVAFAIAPVGDVGDRLVHAGRMEEVVIEETTLSNILEVRRLQRAFVRMSQRLALVRPYLPHHVVGYAGDVGEEDSAENDDVDDAASLASPTSVRSGVTSSSSQYLHGQLPFHHYQHGLGGGGGLPRNASTGSFGLSLGDGKARVRRTASTMSRGVLRAGGGGGVRENRAASLDPAAALAASVAVADAGYYASALESRVVGVLALNLRGFHDFCGESYGGELTIEHDDVSNFTQDYWGLVLAEVRACHGVVELAMGDRILASYNASRICRHHAQGAVRTALRIRAALPRIFQQNSLGAGVAVGTATVGSIGCHALMRFSVLGTCVPQAAALEELSRWYTHQCGPHAAVLTTSRVALDFDTAESIPLDMVELPFLTRPTVVATVLAERDQDADADVDGWLYVVGGGEAGSGSGSAGGTSPPERPLSSGLWDVFTQLRRGHHDRALNLYQDMKSAKDGSPLESACGSAGGGSSGSARGTAAGVQVAAMHNLRALLNQNDTAYPRRDFGEYYKHGILGGRGVKDEPL